MSELYSCLLVERKYSKKIQFILHATLCKKTCVLNFWNSRNLDIRFNPHIMYVEYAWTSGSNIFIAVFEYHLHFRRIFMALLLYKIYHSANTARYWRSSRTNERTSEPSFIDFLRRGKETDKSIEIQSNVVNQSGSRR